MYSCFLWKMFILCLDLYIPIVREILFTYQLIKCSGLALIIYQLTIYPSVEKASGPISIARISAVNFHLIVYIIAFWRFFCYLKYVLFLWSCMQILSIPLLQSYPCIALLSGLALYIVLSIASILKNILSVSSPLPLLVV